MRCKVYWDVSVNIGFSFHKYCSVISLVLFVQMQLLMFMSIDWITRPYHLLSILKWVTPHFQYDNTLLCIVSLYRECCRFFGDDGLTPKVFFTKVAPFGLLWILTNYLYLQALRKINTTDVSALFCCNKAFVFLLSWIVLRDRFMGVRVSPSACVFVCVFVCVCVHAYIFLTYWGPCLAHDHVRTDTPYGDQRPVLMQQHDFWGPG